MEALSDLLLIASTQAQHTAASVKLVANVLVHLAELVELSGDVIVLNLNYLCVLLECVLLSEEVDVLSAEHGIGGLVGVEVLALQVELVLAILETRLELSHLSSHVEVASVLELVFLAQLVQVSHLLVRVSTQQGSVVAETSIQVLSSSDLLLNIIKEQLFVSEVI